MQQDSARRAGRLGKRVGHVALFVALAVVPVLALNSFASAAPGSEGDGRARPALTDAQRQCLAEHGVDQDAAPTREQRREAAQACGLQANRLRPGMRTLTDEQRTCLAQQGVTLPPQTAEQRAALRAAAQTCGLPARGHHHGPGATI